MPTIKGFRMKDGELSHDTTEQLKAVLPIKNVDAPKPKKVEPKKNKEKKTLKSLVVKNAKAKRTKKEAKKG